MKKLILQHFFEVNTLPLIEDESKLYANEMEMHSLPMKN